MEIELIVQIRVERTSFNIKDYICEDNVFALIESGSFTYRTDGKQKNAGPLEAVVFEKNKRYIREITSPACLHFFRYRCQERVFGDDHIVFRDKRRIRSTIEMLNTLYKNLYQDDFEIKKMLFADLVNLYKFENRDAGNNKEITDSAVKDALKFLNEHFCERINLTEVSDYVNLSYVQFARRFKAVTGVTPFEYVADLRMKKAQHLLLSTNMVLSEIAPMCGFENEYYFSNFFKSKIKISPAAFRRGI